jgi:hypothetical protein
VTRRVRTRKKRSDLHKPSSLSRDKGPSHITQPLIADSFALKAQAAAECRREMFCFTMQNNITQCMAAAYLPCLATICTTMNTRNLSLHYFHCPKPGVPTSRLIVVFRMQRGNSGGVKDYSNSNVVSVYLQTSPTNSPWGKSGQPSRVHNVQRLFPIASLASVRQLLSYADHDCKHLVKRLSHLPVLLSVA